MKKDSANIFFSKYFASYIFFISCLTVTFTSNTAQAAGIGGSSETPSPTEWIDGDQPLEFVTELSFGGPNHANLQPFSYTGRHQIGRIMGGTASGPKLSGNILPVGEDWALLRPDGTLEIDVRLLVETEDGAIVEVHYDGLWRGTKEIREKIMSAEKVAPTEYYLRMTPYFSTTSEKYDWLNHTVAVGYGYVQHGVGVRVRIFALK